MCVSTSAKDGERKVSDVKGIAEILAPCTGYIIIKKDGVTVYSGGYASNGPTQQDCSDGFLKHLDKVLSVYSPNEFQIESDVDWNP